MRRSVGWPPRMLDGGAVLCYATIDCPSSGRCRHIVHGQPATFTRLAIIQYAGPQETYLLYCDDSWRTATDTLHDSVAAAQAQAEFEFPGIGAHWKRLPADA